MENTTSHGIRWGKDVEDKGEGNNSHRGDHDQNASGHGGMKSSRNLLQILLHQYPDFHERMYDVYPNAVLGKEYIKNTSSKLTSLGFTPKNTIPCICLCRDEICQHFFLDIQKQWSTKSDLGAFNMSSLAGIINIGKTGLKAAESHAPTRDGTERYVFYGFTHIAIGEGGEIGVCIRPGRAELSHACGALLAVQAKYRAGEMTGAPAIDWDDVEASLVCRAIQARLSGGIEGFTPSLESITAAACDEISDRMARLIEVTTKDRACNYALFTGVQIHGPDGNDYVHPAASYAVVEGVRHEIRFDGRLAFNPSRTSRSKSRPASVVHSVAGSRAGSPPRTSKHSLEVQDIGTDDREHEHEHATPQGAAESVTVVQAFSPSPGPDADR
eukprot:tig00001042_g6601.t1